MLKAYKELEHLGLVAARPGIGIFVTKTLSDDSLAAHGPLRQSLQRWVRQARRAGLDDESIDALYKECLRSDCSGGRSVTAVLEANGLGKRYGHKWALSECTLAIPAGKVVGLVGPNGAGKTTLLQLSVGLLRPSAGSISVLGGRPGTTSEPTRSRRLRRPGHARPTPGSRSPIISDSVRG